MTRGRDLDDSPEGIKRRSEHAAQVFSSEIALIGSEVGEVMALAALLGCSSRYAREAGISRDTFVALAIDMLHDVMHPAQVKR